MCGIAGAVTLSGAALASARFKPMVDAMAHRGPDDAGFLVWHTGRHRSRSGSYGRAYTEAEFSRHSPLLPLIDSPAGVESLEAGHWDLFLGHRRLAIIDLTARAHQPMSDRARRAWIVFNGEIYNFRELRSELAALGYEFSSDSDTEVVLHAYQEWGEASFAKLNGMFAIALWDVDRQRLLLARDRYGVKPLYYCQDGALFAFASEIKPLLVCRGGRPSLDPLALNEYLSFQNVLSDRTLFAGIRMLPPGHVVTIDVGASRIERRQFWDFDFSSPIYRPDAVAADTLGGLIEQAVRRQCVADVPLGSYLSGGMDSGTVAAVASRVFGRITTFTAGFDLSEAASHELAFDEREFAEHMASSLQSEHYEVVLHSGDMEAILDWLVWHLEDLRIGQCYPNALVARLASKFVKVVMSGAGGDELFGGYPWRYAAAVGRDGDAFAANYYRYWKRLVADEHKAALFTPDFGAHLAAELGTKSFGEHTADTFSAVLGACGNAASTRQQVELSLYFECKTFLHGLLVVEDKLSMAHSLETRVPFLDNDLVDFACTVPVEQKLAQIDQLKPLDENLPRKKAFYAANAEGAGKVILRQAMERILPGNITGARKQGFSAPDESWFRGRSETFVRRRLLAPGNALHEYINRDFIATTLDAHGAGRTNQRLLIWSLLSLESWLRQFLK